MNITKTISSVIEKGRRIIKVLRYGKSDIQTAFEALAPGDDSPPIKDLRAIYSPTTEKGKAVIIGYINKNQIASPGEKRLYATSPLGTELGYIYLTRLGQLELNGNVNSAVKHEPLQAAITAYNAQIVKELGFISAAITSLGGSYTPGTLQPDITLAKSLKVKLG